MELFPDWAWGIARDVLAGIVLIVITSLVTRAATLRSARRHQAEWTLEHVVGMDWTLRRDSTNRALEVRIYQNSPYFESIPPMGADVKFKGSRLRNDFEQGAIFEIENLPFGASVAIEWIEQGMRAQTTVLTRESIPKVVVTMNDVRRLA